MVELKNDMMRRARFDTASREAQEDDFDYAMHRTMDERLHAMRERQLRPKKRLPWFTIISILSCAPLFFMGGGDTAEQAIASLSSSMPAVYGVSTATIENAKNMLQDTGNAQVSITLGDRTVTREISPQDMEALQYRMQ